MIFKRTAAALGIAVAMGIVLVAPALGSPALAALAAPPGSAQHLTGKYVLLHADSARSEISVPAIAVGPQTYRLHGKSSFPFKPGQPVQASGTIHGHDMTVTRIAATGAAAPTAPGTLNVLVVLVYWTAPDSVTQAQAQQQYDVTNNTWFYDASYGHMTEHGTATPWLSIAAPSDPDGSGPLTPCDNINTIQAEGDQAATAAGYNPSAFSNVVYYYPTCAGEQWGGWGQVGGNRTWLIGEMDTRVAVHELGHNLGLNHSHSATCTLNGVTVAYSTSCSMNEYGDPISAMGGGFSGQGMYVANQDAYLGWLGTTGHAVTTVTASGTYNLTPLESMPGGVQALKVTNSAGVEFWIEYRQPLNDDSFVWSGDTDGVLIHSGDSSIASTLYDMTPSTPGDFTDAALPVGNTWSDPTSSLSVSVNSATASGASVTVNLGTPPPVTLSVSRTGTGSGTVSSQPAGISCGASCSANFPSGSTVTLTETPAAGTTFAGWSGACTGMASTCMVTMNSSQSVSASFTTSYTLTVSEAGTGTGTITSSPAGINCTSGTCSASFPPGTVVTLTESAPSGTVFTGWNNTGACPAGMSSSACTLTMSGNQATTAWFSAASQLYQEGSATYKGTWKTSTCMCYSGGTDKYTQASGASASFTFTGNRIQFVSEQSAKRGSFKVYLDGKLQATVSNYNATATYNAVVVWSHNFTASGKHTLKVVNVATSGHPRLDVDAFIVGT